MWVKTIIEQEEAWGAMVDREVSELIADPGEENDAIAQQIFDDKALSTIYYVIDEVMDDEIELNAVEYYGDKLVEWFYKQDMETITKQEIFDRLEDESLC